MKSKHLFNIYDSCDIHSGMNNVYYIFMENLSCDDINSFYLAYTNIIRERNHYIKTIPPSYEYVREWCLNNIKQQELHLITKYNNALVGSCDIYSRRYEGAPHIGVLSIFVVKGYRGCGIASQLLKDTLEKAQQRGFEKIELEVLANNSSAIRCYKKFGFFQEGVRHKAKKARAWKIHRCGAYGKIPR